MTDYHVKKAIEILQKEGIVTLCRKSAAFIGICPKARLQNIKYNNMPHFNRPYSIPVSEIKYIIRSEKYMDFFGGSKPCYRIWGGDWHKLKEDISTLYEYQSFEQRFCEGKGWEETIYYDKIKNTNRHSGVENPIDYLNYYEEIFYDMKKHGYKKEGYIDVFIGPNGEYIRKDGPHRLSMAKIIDDIDNIWVNVISVHKKWQELRDEIHNRGLPENREDLRYHPDLQDVLD